MKVLTYDSVRVETGFAIESLRELEVKLVPGTHGTAWIRGFVDAETATAKLQSPLKNSQVKVFEVDENGTQVGKPIFEGIVLDAEVGEENGYTEVKINAVTGTILLDMEKKSRSFQDVTLTYRDVVKKVLEDTQGAHGIFTVGMDTKIEKPLIQFEETDWQFIRRLVSHFSSELIPEVEMCRPNFWFGMRESSATADFSDNMYDVHVDGKYYDMGGDAIGLKRADYLYYSVVDGQNLSIGDKVIFRDKSLIIGEKYAKFERGELLFHYKLCRPAYVGIKPYYNEIVCGLSLPGTVRKTEKEVLYIDLDIDKDREKGVLYHYAWVPTTGNLMYCMPKIGTRVFLYIPDHDERHAMSTSCIRTNGKQHPQMADYHNRYFTTEHFKQMNMLPDSMALIGVGEMEKPLSITMHDAMGISVSSHKTIVLRAGKGISISGKNVVFKTQRELRVIQGLGGTAKIEICNKIDVDAPKTNVKMTYHGATGRPQEKPSPDEDALAKVLMFVMGAAMITCVTATADLGPAGLMFCAMAGRVLPRITTGSGQIMMITGAAVPTLTAEALKRLGERLQALKNALISLGTYFPYSIFADQIFKQIPDELPPLYDGPYPDQENPWTEAAWDWFENIGIAIADDISGENRTYTPIGNDTAFSVGRIAGHTGSLIGSFLGMIAGAFGVAAGGAEAVAAIPTTGGTLSGFGAAVASGSAAFAVGSVGVAENTLENAGSDPNISFSQSNGGGGNTPKGTSNPKLKWGNPKSTPTYGHTFFQHGQKLTPKQLIDRANGFERPHQVGQWMEDKQAADFLSEAAQKGEGVHDIKLPSDIKARTYLPDGTEVKPDMAKVIVKSDGSIRTAYPYSSLYPN